MKPIDADENGNFKKENDPKVSHGTNNSEKENDPKVSHGTNLSFILSVIPFLGIGIGMVVFGIKHMK
jgi:hypothetical protein